MPILKAPLQTAGQLARTSYGQIIGLAVAGAFAGLLFFAIGLLGGWPRFVVVGSLIGLGFAVAILVLARFRARLQLTKVTVRVLGQEAEFVVNARYRQAAWKLFIETMTRIATQPLEPSAGKAREALSSLYSLFETTRSLLKEIEPTPTTEGRTVEGLAIEMLNTHIRPFLARWHPVLPLDGADGSIGEADEQRCREELEALRQKLLGYARTFGELAGVQQLEEFFGR
jgi:hypothetical protein